MTFLLQLLGCPPPTPTPPTEPTVTPIPSGTGPCGPEARVLGPSEGFGTVRLEFNWSRDVQSGLSIGPMLEVDVRENIRGLTIMVDDPGFATGFARLSYGEETLVDAELPSEEPGAWASPPFVHFPALGGSVSLPMDAATDPVGGGCLRIQPVAFGLTSVSGTVWVVGRNGPADVATTIDLNVAIVGDTAIEPAAIDTMVERIDGIWTNAGGPGVGTVEVYNVFGPSVPTDDELNAIRRTVVDNSRLDAVNLFLVQDFVRPGILGEAGGIPGPLGVQGIDAAGVIASIDGHSTVDGFLVPQRLGGTMAHEIGHQLGLFHTTESDGSRFESLMDTPECPVSADVDGDGLLNAEECSAFDGSNVMFWVADPLPQSTMSDQQAFVLERSPVSAPTP